MAPTGIPIYAELLANIRQVSVGATLASPPDSSTAAQVLDGGRRLRLCHGGCSEVLDLPAPVASGVLALPVPQGSSPELSWRLPVSPADAGALRFTPENQAVPWHSADLKPASPTECRGCRSPLVSRGTIRSWKDLPSENWAEMMEFWHCHKPHDHGQPDAEALASRGYGANNAITAQPRVGFVDITSFMFSEADCRGLTFSATASGPIADSSSAAMGPEFSGKFLHVFCDECGTEVGLYSTLAVAVSLFKWQVTCETVSASRGPSGPECLAATLLSTIARSGCSKSVVAPHASDIRRAISQNLHIWVLNPNVVFTSSSSGEPRAALKVLYRDIGSEEGTKLVESMNSDVQDINMPMAAIEAAREALRLSNSLLPERERAFKGWRTGLLERWTPGT